MNGKIGIRVISVVLAVMLVSVVVPTVSAQVAAEVSGDTSLETINDLRGKDISMGEFYEKIAPVEFSALPAEIQNECYNTKMVWLELPKSAIRFRSYSTMHLHWKPSLPTSG